MNSFELSPKHGLLLRLNGELERDGRGGGKGGREGEAEKLLWDAELYVVGKSVAHVIIGNGYIQPQAGVKVGDILSDAWWANAAIYNAVLLEIQNTFALNGNDSVVLCFLGRDLVSRGFVQVREDLVMRYKMRRHVVFNQLYVNSLPNMDDSSGKKKNLLYRFLSGAKRGKDQAAFPWRKTFLASLKWFGYSGIDKSGRFGMFFGRYDDPEKLFPEVVAIPTEENHVTFQNIFGKITTDSEEVKAETLLFADNFSFEIQSRHSASFLPIPVQENDENADAFKIWTRWVEIQKEYSELDRKNPDKKIEAKIVVMRNRRDRILNNQKTRKESFVSAMEKYLQQTVPNAKGAGLTGDPEWK